MPPAVIIVGAVDGCRRDLERHLGDRAELLLIRLARNAHNARFRLEPHPQNAVQMVEAAADRATAYDDVLILLLPYAACPDQLAATIVALGELGAKIVQPRPGAGRWPSRPPFLDRRFQAALRDALQAAIDDWLPGAAPMENVAAAVARARSDFADTLHIPENVDIDTSLDGPFWYRVLRALHELCEIERQGAATNKRSVLSGLLAKHINRPRQTYKVADTGVFAVNPMTGQRIELRERVHIMEGRPAETESIYWTTYGETQASFQYLIGRIGRHA